MTLLCKNDGEPCPDEGRQCAGDKFFIGCVERRRPKAYEGPERREFTAQLELIHGRRHFATVDVDLGAGWMPDRREKIAPASAIYQERNRLRLEIHKLRNALADIAYCRIPGAPDGVAVQAQQFGPFAQRRAQEALGNDR